MLRRMMFLGGAIAFALPLSAQGAFVPVETFEGLTNGALNGQNGWTATNAGYVVGADPADAGNQVMVVSAGTAEHTAYKAMSAITNSSTASTLFFRVRRAGQVNMSWGTSDVAAPGVFNDFESQLNIQNGSTSTLRVRSAGFAEPVDAFAVDTWYSTWMVINNSTDTYEVYMQGGALGSVTKLDDDDGANIGNSVFGFRNGAATNDLATLLIRNGSSHTADFFVDDIYLDTTGQNLSNPVPEPTCVAPAAVAGMALLARRRRGA